MSYFGHEFPVVRQAESIIPFTTWSSLTENVSLDVRN